MAERESAAGMKLTYDDFVLFPDDGKRHELIDGEHYVTPSPNTKHQQVSLNLILEIGGWLKGHPIGRIFHAPYDVVLSLFDVVEPDLLYLSNERAAEVMSSQHLRGAPEMVVEIAKSAWVTCRAQPPFWMRRCTVLKEDQICGMPPTSVGGGENADCS